MLNFQAMRLLHRHDDDLVCAARAAEDPRTADPLALGIVRGGGMLTTLDHGRVLTVAVPMEQPDRLEIQHSQRLLTRTV